MQFSILTILTLATAAMGAVIPRQTTSEVVVETAAMSDKDGNVVPFDSKGVNQPNKDAGL